MENQTLLSRFKNAWNVFLNRSPTRYNNGGYYYRPDRIRLARGNERSIINAVLNRISVDAAAVRVEHVKLDKNDGYSKSMDTKLNNCLTIEANLDQTARAFLQDAVLSLLDEGCIAIVPVETDINPYTSSAYDISNLRVGKIKEWLPDKVKIRLYNERTGKQEDILIHKRLVAIVENPFYSVMNEPNSTMSRLSRKLGVLDVVDEHLANNKLDMIIQLPYTIKSSLRRQQAEERRNDIINQLTDGSGYGIAYTDGTEKITQLSRPLENNLLAQIESLKTLLFSQLNITEEILNGTADPKTMSNYYNRTIEPILSAITEEMTRKFLTSTARTQKQSIRFFIDPFKLVPVSDLAEIADKFTRNEIMSSNEFRQILGMKPDSNPQSDQLINSNNITYGNKQRDVIQPIKTEKETVETNETKTEIKTSKGENQNGV